MTELHLILQDFRFQPSGLIKLPPHWLILLMPIVPVRFSRAAFLCAYGTSAPTLRLLLEFLQSSSDMLIPGALFLTLSVWADKRRL